jgi:microcystin degradation protein MlrC
VLLGLHGALVVQDYDEVEGDILARVRDVVGTGCVIGAEMDPHCHLTRKRVAIADIIILFKEFPHTDVLERGERPVWPLDEEAAPRLLT